jgi:hypothetical protein
VAVVWVDAASFAGVDHVPGAADAAALQLAASGVAVARVRAGDDIGEVLSSAMARKAGLRG